MSRHERFDLEEHHDNWFASQNVEIVPGSCGIEVALGEGGSLHV